MTWNRSKLSVSIDSILILAVHHAAKLILNLNPKRFTCKINYTGFICEIHMDMWCQGIDSFYEPGADPGFDQGGPRS